MKDAIRQCDVNLYFQQQVSRYANRSERGIWRRWKERELVAVRDHLEPLGGRWILEVGCGSGWYARRLMACRPGAYVASDCLLDMVRHVRGIGAMRMVLDLTQLPFRATFDRILCAGALEFVPVPARFFRAAAAALRPGGKAVVLVPPADLPGRMYRLWHRRHGFRIHLFSEDALEAMGAEVGLHLTRVSRPAPYSLVVTLETRT